MHMTTPETASLLLTNATLVLPETVSRGTVYVSQGVIRDIDSRPSSAPHAVDCQGDMVLPGLVELHTDNLEKHAVPRPQVRWPMVAAVLAHDAELAAAGITTVCNGITVGTVLTDSLRSQIVDDSIRAITWACTEGLTKAEHYFHLRCEISTPNVLEVVKRHRTVEHLRLISIMDHTPGQRQWINIDKYRARIQTLEGLDARQMEAHLQQRWEYQRRYAANNEGAILAWSRCRGLPVASHDDTTVEHTIEAAKKGIRIAEFPTTLAAADMARRLGMLIVMGAPNLILGGSHSGNIATAELAAHRLVDILSSDYVPTSLLAAALRLHHDLGFCLPEAIATVTASPAQAVGLSDRGSIAIGKRADLLRVTLKEETPLIRAVWRAGQRVA